MDNLEEFKWIVVFGGIVAFMAAAGIGANDVANAYATSVGSKALTVPQACFLAVIFEFAGAVLAGNTVAKTIRKGIADHSCYDDGFMDAGLLMYGCLCVVASVGMWLFLASYLEMPVSTTHSAVGGMVGMAVVTKGSGCVTWFKEGDEDSLWIPGGVTGIVISWVLSPMLSALFAVSLFYTVRTFILRSKNAFKRSIVFYPVLVLLAVWINAYFVVSKGIKKKICEKGKDSWICYIDGDVKPLVAMGFSFGIGLFVALFLIPVYGMISRKIEEEFSGARIEDPVQDAKTEAPQADEPRGRSFVSPLWNALSHSMKVDPHASIGTDSKVTAVHDNAEKFDQKAEAVFRYIQIFTAICDSFAHGANDVANAMGPFMAIYVIYHQGEVGKSADAGDDAYWILALGGLGIGIGLLTYGYKIMRAIGVKLAVVTPSRGFAIELGAAIVIIMGSYLGLPLSTTHCQVGATTGVALLEGKKGVNTWVLFKTVIGWFITLVVVGTSTGLLVAQGIYAPIQGNPQSPGNIQYDFLNEQCPAFTA